MSRPDAVSPNTDSAGHLSGAATGFTRAESKMRQLAEAALSEHRVDLIIGWKAGYLPSEVVPAFLQSPDGVSELVWNRLAHHNLTAFLKRKMGPPGGARVGICVKGCDSRTLVALLQEDLVARDRLYIIGLPCSGIVDRRRVEKQIDGELIRLDVDEDRGVVVAEDNSRAVVELPLAEYLLDICRVCRYPNPLVHDDMAGDEVEPAWDGTPEWPRVEEFERLTPAERDAALAQAFSTCIRCYACINACPVCWCWDQCVTRFKLPGIASQRVGSKENLMFQMVHMFHVAGRCPSCGACDRACPMEIPLHLLHGKMNRELWDMLRFEAGASLDEKPAFQVFRLEDALGEE